MAGIRETLDLDDSEFDKLKSSFEGIDQAGTGQIDYAQFVSAGMNRHIQLSNQNLRVAFESIAQNGVITIEGLTQKFQLAKIKGEDLESQESINENEPHEQSYEVSM